jgi:hypothetical protein
MKRAAYLLGGVCCLLTSGVSGWLLLRYLMNGAGLEIFGPSFSPGSVFLGLIPLAGLFFASAISLGLGIVWCAQGLVAGDRHEANHH